MSFNSYFKRNWARNSFLFAEEGANVVLVGRDEALLKAVKAAIQANKGNAIFIKADVSNPKSMERVVAEAC